MTMALDDVRVLDLSHALAGPFASTLLGDFGADVVTVEPPGDGDISRAWGPPFYGSTDAVLRQRLGLDDAEITRLRAAGALGRRR